MLLFCAEKNVKEELINSSWCGVLAGLTVLLDARYVSSYHLHRRELTLCRRTHYEQNFTRVGCAIMTIMTSLLSAATVMDN